MNNVVKLNDLLSNDWDRKDLFVYAVVVATTKPKPTAIGANDKYTASYTLTDESITMKQFVTLNLFGNDINKFPVILSAGNIMRITMVKKQVHKGVVQLVGNLRKIDYLVFYKKVNLVTGFGVVPYPPIQPQSSSSSSTALSPEETRFLVAEEAIAREDILHALEPSRSVGGSQVISNPTSMPWVLYNYSHTGFINNAALTPATANQVHNLLSWAFRSLFSESMTEGTPLMEPNATANELIPKVPSHTPIRKITRSDWGMSSEQSRCDVVALVVQVILRENSLSELIVWDGTLSHGVLSKDSYVEAPNTIPSRVIIRKPNVLPKVSIFRDVCHGLFTSCLFASDTPSFPEKLKSILESSHADDYTEFETNTLMGDAVCITTADSTLNSHIACLRAGQWIRLRNLHLDYSPFHSAMRRVNLGGQEIVASIYSDSHITPIFPFFRDAMTVANQYQKLLQLARSSNTFPGTRVAPYTQSSNAVQTSSSSSSTAMMNTTTVATAGATAAQSSSSAAASVNNGVSSNGSGPQMIRSSKNSPIHPLAYALASVAPSKHCVRVRVTGIWPTTALELVTNTNINTAENGNSQSVPGNAIENSSSPNTTYTPHWVFMFALRVQDETATADVILYDKEAEYFLGVSATEYVNNEEVREGVFNRLQLLMTTNTNSTIILELFLQSYHSIEKRTQRSVKRLAVLETALSDAQI